MNDCFGGMGVYAVVSAEDSNEDWRKKKAKYQQLRVWEEFEERQLQNEKFLILWTATHPHFCTQGFTPAQPLRTHATSIDCIVPPYSHHSNMFYIFTYNILFWGRSVRISIQWLGNGAIRLKLAVFLILSLFVSTRYFHRSLHPMLRRYWGGRAAIEMWGSGLRCEAVFMEKTE